jgi:hypothetical protein
MKPLFTLLLLAASLPGAAQRIVDVNSNDHNIGNFFQVVGGEPVSNTKFVKLVEGSPFFEREWIKSTLISMQGGVYENIPVKLNLLEGRVHYLDRNDVEMIANTAIREVVFSHPSNGKHYRFINGSVLPESMKGWYLLLHNDSATLMKSFEKSIMESQPYGSATTEQKIRTTPKYFLLYNNQMQAFKNIKELQEVLIAHRGKLHDLIQKQNTKVHLDDRLVEIVAYYNTLIKEKPERKTH